MTKKNIDKLAIKTIFTLTFLGLIGKAFVFFLVGAVILTVYRELC